VPYILNTPEDEQVMLKAIGAASVEELFAPIPSEARLHRPLDIPPALGEIELTQHVAALGRKNQAAGDNAGAVAAKLRAAGSLVPGSLPTAAEVAESGGIAALQRTAAQANPEAYTTRAMQQASARLGALRGIAGDDVAMEAARAARDTAATPLYDAAKAATMQNTPELASGPSCSTAPSPLTTPRIHNGWTCFVDYFNKLE
jgi:hypothetical protein